MVLPALVALVVGLLPVPSSAALPAPERATPVVAAGAATPPQAAAAHRSEFVDRINDLRAANGVRPLQASPELLDVAGDWTDHLVQTGRLAHNPELASQVSGGWTKLGENVGVGHSVDGLMRAFMESPTHRANLVDPQWTHVGVGVALDAEGRIYTTHDFMALPHPEPAHTLPAAAAAHGRAAPGAGTPGGAPLQAIVDQVLEAIVELTSLDPIVG